MTQVNTHNDLRKFGLILGGLFAVIFGFMIPTIGHHQIPVWPWIITSVLWVPAAIYPKALTYVYRIWMKVGDVLGFINTRIILTLLFFFIIWPIGLIKRTLSKDVMGRSFDLKANSYRIIVEPKNIKHMEKPF